MVVQVPHVTQSGTKRVSLLLEWVPGLPRSTGDSGHCYIVLCGAREGDSRGGCASSWRRTRRAAWCSFPACSSRDICRDTDVCTYVHTYPCRVYTSTKMYMCMSIEHVYLFMYFMFSTSSMTLAFPLASSSCCSASSPC